MNFNQVKDWKQHVFLLRVHRPRVNRLLLIGRCPSVQATAFLSADEAANVASVGSLLVEGWATSRKVSGCFQHSLGQDDVQAA